MNLKNRIILEDYRKQHDDFVKLAEKALANADLDILSSSVGLRFLCRAELLNKNYSFEKATEFLKLSMGTAEKAERQAKHLFRTYEKIRGNVND